MRSKRVFLGLNLLAVKEGISDGIRQPGSLGSVYETMNAMLALRALTLPPQINPN